jgi:putative DNA primase/helicase
MTAADCYCPTCPTEDKLTPEERARRREQAIAKARWIWQEETIGATGTTAQTYLYSRLLLINPMPEVLRFRYGSVRSNRPPAMVARINHVELGSIGIHCTFLLPDGSAKARIRIRDEETSRVTIGTRYGGAVRFGEPTPDKWLIVAEGLETTLSVTQSTDLPGWAALCAGGIRKLVLPPSAQKILIAADNDENRIGQRAAYYAAKQWRREGRDVKIIMPPKVGFDWNDVLLEKDQAVRHAA